MAQAKEKKCLNCSKLSDVKYHPFCSKRCAQVDLGRWFGEGYTIETEEPALAEDYEGLSRP